MTSVGLLKVAGYDIHDQCGPSQRLLTLFFGALGIS